MVVTKLQIEDFSDGALIAELGRRIEKPGGGLKRNDYTQNFEFVDWKTVPTGEVLERTADMVYLQISDDGFSLLLDGINEIEQALILDNENAPNYKLEYLGVRFSLEQMAQWLCDPDEWRHREDRNVELLKWINSLLAIVNKLKEILKNES